MRKPVVVGAHGGVGTTLLAAALQGVDAGRAIEGGQADVLVCRSTAASVLAAQQALAQLRTRPLLAVVADIPRAHYPAAALARLRTLDPHVAGQVCFPFVGSWRELEDPAARAAQLMTDPPDRGPEREYLRGLRMAITALCPMVAAPPAGGAPRRAPDREGTGPLDPVAGTGARAAGLAAGLPAPAAGDGVSLTGAHQFRPALAHPTDWRHR